jgi:Asp-tRNA(Asn)/Glu-tRNA(Gln) amidotransferase A subunit family amidase
MILPTIHSTAADIRAGRLTPVDVLERCLVRISEYEKDVRAWVFVDEEAAREDAQRATDELRRGDDRGPLHGIPIGIKDIIDVFDWPTACGSKRWEKSVARQDAPVVRRLREAGAVIVGKTVTTQYASFDPPPTRNPWNHERTPGGSSSGSAAAVACGMCLGALGTQTGGSITRPAAFCGVAGYKPSYGRVGTSGVLPLAHSMDHVGVLALCVRDLVLMLNVIAGPDAGSATPALHLSGIGRSSESPVAPRLGRLRGMFDDLAEPAMRALLDTCIKAFQARGAVVTEVALPASFAEVLHGHRMVMGVEAALYHEQRLRRHPEEYLPNIRSLIEEGMATTPAEYLHSKKHQRRLSDEMRTCFEGVDVLLTSAARGPAPPADATGDPAFNSPWSYTGLPTVSLPAGRDTHGLPLAIQLIAPPWEEASLLRAAVWCEQVLAYEPILPPR